MMESCQATCPYCTKEGLSILPMRAAVARTDKGSALDLPAALQQSEWLKDDQGKPIALPADSAKYSGRLLRAGFLYVFNEVRGEWKGYAVSEKGYLYEFMKVSGRELDDPDKDSRDIIPPPQMPEFSCDFTDDEFKARCVTIPYAKDAGKVWLGFSDTAWTWDVLQAHRKQAVRDQHMQMVDVQAWVAGNTQQADTLPFNQLTQAINEFAEAPLDSIEQAVAEMVNIIKQPLGSAEQIIFPAFSCSAHQFFATGHMTERFAAWGEQEAAKDLPPMIAMVSDPVGVTADLASLSNARQSEFLAKKENAEPMAMAALISSLKKSIEENARQNKIQEVINKADKMAELKVNKKLPKLELFSPATPNGIIARRDKYKQLKKENQDKRAKLRKKYREEERRIALEQLTADELEVITSKAWSRYEEKLQPNEPKNWQETVLKEKLERFNENTMNSLLDTHQSWFFGTVLQEKMLLNHSEVEVESGVGFVQALLFCLQSTQEYQQCYSNYVKALEEGEEGLLLRAMVFNQRQILDDIKSFVPKEGVDAKSLIELPWRDLFDSYTHATESLAAGSKNILTQFLAAIGSPISYLLSSSVDGLANRALVATGVVSEAVLVRSTYHGKLSDALDALVKQMKAVNPELKNVDSHLLKQQLAIESKGKRDIRKTRNVVGEFNGQDVEFSFNRFRLMQVDASTSTNESIRLAAESVIPFDQMPKEGMARFKSMFNTNARFAVVGLLVDGVGFCKFGEAMDEVLDPTSTIGKRSKNIGTMLGTSMAVSAGGFEIANHMLEGVLKSGYSKLSPKTAKLWMELTSKWGLRLGFGATAIFAVIDFYDASIEYRKGHTILVYLHSVSGIASVGSFAALAVGASMAAAKLAGALIVTGVGIILLIAAIAIGGLILYITNDPLQDWLERTNFGTLFDTNPFSSLEETMQTLEKALNEMGEKPEDNASGHGEYVMAR